MYNLLFFLSCDCYSIGRALSLSYILLPLSFLSFFISFFESIPYIFSYFFFLSSGCYLLDGVASSTHLVLLLYFVPFLSIYSFICGSLLIYSIRFPNLFTYVFFSHAIIAIRRKRAEYKTGTNCTAAYHSFVHFNC